MRTLLILLLLTGSARAEPSQADFKRLADALFSQMALTYICRDALGGMAHYQASRTVATETVAHYIGRNEAVKIVGKMDAKFRNDPRNQHPNVDLQSCQEMVNDGYFRIEQAKAAIPD